MDSPAINGPDYIVTDQNPCLKHQWNNCMDSLAWSLKFPDRPKPHCTPTTMMQAGNNEKASHFKLEEPLTQGTYYLGADQYGPPLVAANLETERSQKSVSEPGPSSHALCGIYERLNALEGSTAGLGKDITEIQNSVVDVRQQVASTNQQLAEVTHSFTRIVGVWEQETKVLKVEHELSKEALRLVVQNLQNLSSTHHSSLHSPSAVPQLAEISNPFQMPAAPSPFSPSAISFHTTTALPTTISMAEDFSNIDWMNTYGSGVPPAQTNAFALLPGTVGCSSHVSELPYPAPSDLQAAPQLTWISPPTCVLEPEAKMAEGFPNTDRIDTEGSNVAQALPPWAPLDASTRTSGPFSPVQPPPEPAAIQQGAIDFRYLDLEIRGHRKHRRCLTCHRGNCRGSFMSRPCAWQNYGWDD